MTPFVFSAVFGRDPAVERVTYLDADLGFNRDPRILLDELDASAKRVLITEHGFAPEYAGRAASSGRFCVQFLTVCRDEEAQAVIDWWRDRCLDWCFARKETGRFGDQMYLDEWPIRFGGVVHILAAPRLTLAPWNARHALGKNGSGGQHVFYHFHELRMVSRHRVRLFWGYPVGKRALPIYREHLRHLAAACAMIEASGCRVRWPEVRDGRSARALARNLWRRLIGQALWAHLP